MMKKHTRSEAKCASHLGVERHHSAFTLVEMILAITIFSTFIGFVLTTYVTFHRVQQEAAVTREVLMEAENVLLDLTDALKENFIDFDAYAIGQGSGDILGDVEGIAQTEALESNTLYLISPDGAAVIYDWDELVRELVLQQGEAEAERIHSEDVYVSHLSFEIFPSVDPYDSVNVGNDDAQFQPIVKIKMTFAASGRASEEVDVSFETSVTSRFYQ
jgi:prepilin-type N-terminal cleavage/methylation domain-containing protein